MKMAQTISTQGLVMQQSVEMKRQKEPPPRRDFEICRRILEDPAEQYHLKHGIILELILCLASICFCTLLQ